MAWLRRPWLHFLVIGALLFALQVLRSPSERRQVVVPRSEIAAQVAAHAARLGRPPTAREARGIEDQVVETALWLDRAFALGLHEVDPVVQERLALNMRFLEGGDGRSEAALVQRAHGLGMPRSDPVVRRRLVERVQALVRAGVRARSPDAATLRRYHELNRERWREPERLDLTHVYLSRDARGSEAARTARALLERLRETRPTLEEAVALGDPFLVGHHLRAVSPEALAARIGPRFAEALAEAPPLEWWGPVRTAFGEHLVWVQGRTPSRVPPLSEVRERVLADWHQTRTHAALRAQLQQLRGGADVRIVDDRGAETAASTR